MKKIISLLSLSAIALMGCDAKAQNGTAVGNPDSDNILVIEQGYEAVTVPVDAVNAPVAPANAKPAVNTQQPNLQPATDNNAAVLENVTETQTPNSEEIDIDAAVVPASD